MEKTPMVHMMDYFKSEYKDAERAIKEKVRWAKPREVIDNAIQRIRKKSTHLVGRLSS